MRTFFFVLAAGLWLTAPAVQAQSTTATASASTGTPAQRKAAAVFLSTMQVEKTLDAAVDQMMTMQIKQRPEIKSLEPEMRAFTAKYMSWASLKEDMISLYATEFTEKELKELTKFYETPVGQKFVGKQSVLMQAGMELGQRRVQENLPELQRTIEAKMKSQEE
ncbi:DUF2059 domain-containing protein [Hymenobacter elongatus]|uniref:DUF2059 domain-containing protein n=1 Tax=Hymenobacter elongatus TaxID=877208 RepID=A0A4Z0PM03_9BACT|nr:DUF2059 domain-containing protein [Hymenobacter elongatus]TGE15175.1 DUF2059 domain-containing protein [Hymenobacter elongatus]